MKRRTIFILSAFFLATVLGSFAQINQKNPPLFGGSKKDDKEEENVRSVQGAVRNQAENPVEGAVVQLKDTKSLRIRSFITRKDGTYRFNGLSTNIDYELKAEHDGAASPVKTLSVFDSRKVAVVNLQLESQK